jgi:PAS domain S-box-containing protein
MNIPINSVNEALVFAEKALAKQKEAYDKLANVLAIAEKELIYLKEEKGNRDSELDIANIELAFQYNEKGKHKKELRISNMEMAMQGIENEIGAEELVIENKELSFQRNKKEKHSKELSIANSELNFQNKEKEKREFTKKKLDAFSNSLKSTSKYSLSLIEASRDPLFTISPCGKITDLNEASVKVTGVARKKMIGSDFSIYFTNPEKAKDGYSEVFNKGFVSDFPLTLKDHKLTDVLFNGAIYKDEEGNVIGAVVVARDITEQKRIEKELIEAKVLAEMATVLAEEAKLNAENATIIAQEAVKSKQQFLSNMSHEIRTPMNAIIGFTKVVLKTELTAKQKEYLMAIKMSGDSLIVLINDILDIAKVDSGKMSFEKIPFKLKFSIMAMLHLFEIKIQEKNLKLVVNYDDTIPDVLLGDPIRLHQIILNLVSNAVKFTSKGTITIAVSLQSENDQKVALHFSVADTGIGIKPKKIDKIFDNFQQASSGTSRLYGGSGLGLSIVKQLVKGQGGTINVVSEFGKGSIFNFTLDYKKTTQTTVLEAEILELDTQNKDIKILVVEDMELNQLLMKTLLDDFGFECDIAGNGKIAVEKLKTKTFDIILMDLQMPEMNGFEATKYIRKELKLLLPIIALTADVTTFDIEKCKAAGMNDYISKPVDERLLYSKLVSFTKKPILIIEKNSQGNITSQKVKYVDLSYLNKLTKSNPMMMTEMITAYLTQTPPLILAMRESHTKKDWPMLQAAVHKLLPSFDIMGINSDFTNTAKKIHEYAATLEISKELDDMVATLETVLRKSVKN